MATKKSSSKSGRKSGKKQESSLSSRSSKKSAKKRGSSKLAAVTGRGGANSASISRFVATLRRHRLNPNILIDGVPNPDIIRGTFTARDTSGLSSGLTALFKLKDAQYKPLRLFPDGVPVPDIFRVEFDARFRG